jgi:hypothetical protein
MPYEIYNFIHILGLILVVYSFGIAFLRSTGQDKRKWPMMINGIGLALILLGGFGMAARLGYTTGFPTWVLFKIGFWVVLGFIPVILRKFSAPAYVSALAQIGLVLVAAGFGIFKPMS